MSHFSWLGHFLKVEHRYIHIPHTLLTSSLLILCGIIVYFRLRNTGKALIPSGKIGVASIFEVACQNILELMEGIIGPTARNYFPLVAGLFLFIFCNNILGILPGFLPPTDNINTTLSLGVVVFVYFNYVGIKTQGLWHYIKHFGGPIVALAPLMFVIEMIGILVRPVSLGLRLFGNMTGDHLVLGIFSDLVPVLVPILFLGLGIFVSFIQAFVFSLLTTIYIALALPHEEH
jgi:F-type H+-transporting ATPase subunit a